MQTRISKLLKTEYPILQGGMAWVAEYHLAAAVSNAGGLGIIGAASAPPEVVREQIRKTKELTKNPFGVNVMLLNPNAPEVAQVVIEEGVKVVTTGAGNPGKFMKAWKEAGVVVIPVVASVAMAKMMERGGADAVIAEGMESGGHIGSQTTMTLVPQVADAVSIPVIAAGGIADGRGIAASFLLGAEGVQMGTRFLVAKESIVHPNYKERVIKARDIDSEVTGMSTGHPIRVLRNAMSREYLKMEQEGASFEELEHLTLGSLRKAVVDGDVVNGSLMAGQSAGMVKKEQTCEEIMQEIVKEAEQLMQH
jgi:enoyl-[acyl-carrier protein] reductase II